MSAHLADSIGRASAARLNSALQRAARRALQPRLLVLFVLGMAIPTMLFALPVSFFLGGELNHSPAAATLASSIGLGALIDLIDAPDMSFSLLYAVVVPPLFVMLLISPWLNALALGAARLSRSSGFRALISAANAAYWPMVRIGLFGLLPIVLALVVGQIAAGAVARYDAHAVLQSSVEHLMLMARLFAMLLVALAQSSIEVGRAVLVAHPRRRSVVRAWWAGLAFLRRHPLYLFGGWLLVTVPSLLLAAALMVLRTNLDQGSFPGLVLALVLAEGCVLVLAFMRYARLFLLVDLLAQVSAPRSRT
jgi:hypothetical protein